MLIRLQCAVYLAFGFGSIMSHSARAELGPYQDETSARMSFPNVAASLTTADPDEKDYAWGDVDQDGDDDLIVVRKQPFTTTGKRVNLLLMNEGIADGHEFDGVFVDRTEEYAQASDVEGDLGFDTPTNDRDVILVDLDKDGWLDLVTATTLSVNEPKHISHPRVYMNLGEKRGEWLGFSFENARIPMMHPTEGPRFCSVAAGDVTGDGFPDLYFGDYDGGVTEGVPPQLFDYNNRLLINLGGADPALAGYFTDETGLRLTFEMSQSIFGAATGIADMNNDGFMDLIKHSALDLPYQVAITYNNPELEGFFSSHEVVNNLAPYFVSVGELNNDGRLDLVITDDATDRYLLNFGVGSDGMTNFLPLLMPDSTDGFGGNSYIADLDHDGWQDVIVTDVDVDLSGCWRTSDILRNNADPPHVTFSTDFGGIPENQLTGVHDVAVFDINRDGWNDLILGRCSGTVVWVNQNEPIILPCPEDLDGSGEVGFSDLLILLDGWGQAGIAADLDGGSVGFSDLLLLLDAWGFCQ